MMYPSSLLGWLHFLMNAEISLSISKGKKAARILTGIDSKTQNRQHNTEGGEQSWRSDTARQLRVTINLQQSRNSVVCMKEQTSRSMTKKREPGNRPKEIQPIITDKG